MRYLEPLDGLRLALRLPGLRRRAQGPGGGGPRGRGRADAGAARRSQDPAQASYHNHTARELALAVFSLAAVEGHPSVEGRAAPLRAQAWRAFDNLLEQTELVNPDGGYHESTDYMRITWAPLAMMAEVRRTATGEDPAARWSVFRNMGTTYLYKVLPDGSEARDDDDEFPHLDSRDNVVLGYAVHRFKDPYAAWLLQQRGVAPRRVGEPGARSSCGTTPRSSRATPPRRPRASCRASGSSAASATSSCATAGARTPPGSSSPAARTSRSTTTSTPRTSSSTTRATWRSTPGPTTPTPRARTTSTTTGGPSPTTRCSSTSPARRFFWSENRWPAANDGGQRMDSSRFWNSVRSLEDWRRTRDLWDRCQLVPGGGGARRTATRAPTRRAPTSRRSSSASRARSSTCASRTSLVVLDRVRATDPSYRKAWLLHGVSEPKVEAPAAGASVGHGGTAYRDASLVTFEDGQGRLRVHSLLPREREVIVRGGPGFEFWTPGDERGGAWGSGQNWPLDPPEGGPLPEDPYLLKMWKTFWDGIDRLSPSNRRAVVPGGWRMEVSPAAPSKEDVFLHVLEIGDRDATPAAAGRGDRRAAASPGRRSRAKPSSSSRAPCRRRGDAPRREDALAARSPASSRGASYEVQVTSGFAPGAPVWRATAEAGDEGDAVPALGRRPGRAPAPAAPALETMEDDMHQTTARPSRRGHSRSSWPRERPPSPSPPSASRPPMPKITAPVMFGTPEADRILEAMQVFPPDNPWNQDVSKMPVARRLGAASIASIGADKNLGYNLDMGFILVPPGPEAGAGEARRLPERVGPGALPGARQRADRELAARRQRGQGRADEARARRSRTCRGTAPATATSSSSTR